MKIPIILLWRLNIGSVSDIGYALENGAGGVGLFRSEFLYIGRDSYVFFPLHLLQDLLLFSFPTNPVPRPTADFL
ncbi:MAG: hypothetical protein HFH44_14530 [Lachnospiraceae bacterium]|nr:hypothetical protein [Lachnospiraceae bacterium]